jgi:putative DNA-invertase from lambdoid prophage Rac
VIPKFWGVQLIRKVAVYCRVSTKDQSCERQEQDLCAFAKRAGFEIIGIWKEISTGAKNARPKRKAVMALAQKRQIDVILVTELTRWGRSTFDLVQTLQNLQAWNVSLIAQTGLQFDLSTPQGKLIASIMASLAEFERDLLSERIRSGFAAAKAKGKTFGRKAGDRPKSDRLTPKVCKLLKEGRSYQFIAKELNLSKTTVMKIVHRQRAAENADQV